jgi:hypothetical protein
VRKHVVAGEQQSRRVVAEDDVPARVTGRRDDVEETISDRDAAAVLQPVVWFLPDVGGQVRAVAGPVISGQAADKIVCPESISTSSPAASIAYTLTARSPSSGSASGMRYGPGMTSYRAGSVQSRAGSSARIFMMSADRRPPGCRDQPSASSSLGTQ